ncbi:MAG: hypothetical protein ACI8S6_000724 [Myxococcota bacterium]|jgi:hypothetical protein
MIFAFTALLGCTSSPSPSQSDSGGVEDTAAAWLEELVSDPSTVTLVEAGAWVEVGTESDPFSDRPESVECSALGYGDENGYFEVDTEACGYGTFRQPLLHDVGEGEELLIVYWFLELWSADEGAEGHVAIALEDGELLVDSQVAIPGDPETRKVWLDAPRALAAGEWIYFHVHNHGYNNWSLGTIQAETVQ